MSRADEVAAAARLVLERDGADGLTMRSVAAELGIRAPSLYKHVEGKSAIEVVLVDAAMAEMGRALHDALDHPGQDGPLAAVLAAYRSHALAHPNLYRLATAGRLPRGDLTPGREDWAGEPFLAVTGDAHRAQALWAWAHGMVILELDGRFPDGSDLDRTWAAGAAAFAPGPQSGGSSARAASRSAP